MIGSKRLERLNVEAAGLLLDYSKNLVVAETFELLIRFAEECHLRERIDAMFHGEKINVTEKRAVLHTALRRRNTPLSSWMAKTLCPKSKPS